MALPTPLDELVDYKNKIVNIIESSQSVMSLLVGQQNVDMSSDIVYNAYENQIFDYSFVMDTQLSEKSFLLIEAETRKRPNDTIKNMVVYVQVICHKDNMKLNGFKGVKGNRRDNLARQVTNVLEGRKDFGIGRLMFSDCYAVTVPSPYTSIMIVFETPEFIRGGTV